MGQTHEKLKVVSLNYSSIFVSPFEFYASDNWQQLQKVGIIFEENLKKYYNDIRGQIQNSADIPREDFYMRKSFKWKVDKLDKTEKETRYSPLYIKKDKKEQGLANKQGNGELKLNKYPGITQDHCLMDQKDYYKQWDICFQKIREEFNQTEQLMCRRFDFQCYRAFIQYVYNIPQNYSQLKPQISQQDLENQNFALLKSIVDSINQQQIDKRIALIQNYRKFMDSYFSRIDAPSKVNITIRQLFQKNTFDIICMQQTNNQIISQIRKQDNYYVYIPVSVKEVEDQCIIIINKSCPLIPTYYHQYHQQELDSIQRLKTDLMVHLNSSMQQNERRKQIFKQLENHFDEKVILNIKKSYKNDESYGKRNKEVIFSHLMNPLKIQFDSWLQPYQTQFISYWLQQKQKLKPDQITQIDAVLAEIAQNGLFYDCSTLTIATFKYTNKELKKYQNLDNRLVILSLHFTSREIKNRIQVQTLGLFIYELLRHEYKFILVGDYNSYIDIKDRQKQKGPFIFLKQFYKQNQQIKQMIKDIESQKTIHVFPKHRQIHTTKKKRTILQVQARKINTLAEKCIDQIITNLPILYDECYTGQICHLNSSKNKNKNFIPNREHPYDHFAVEAIISISPES